MLYYKQGVYILMPACYCKFVLFSSEHLNVFHLNFVGYFAKLVMNKKRRRLVMIGKEYVKLFVYIYIYLFLTDCLLRQTDWLTMSPMAEMCQAGFLVKIKLKMYVTPASMQWIIVMYPLSFFTSSCIIYQWVAEKLL